VTLLIMRRVCRTENVFPGTNAAGIRLQHRFLSKIVDVGGKPVFILSYNVKM
jgi:hypothetical protein